MTKVLIIDDSLTVRKIVRRELEPAGFTVFEAGNGEEAIEMIPQVKPDLLTLDVEMPKLNGFDVCRILRFGKDGHFPAGQENAAIPVIFLTANANLEMRIRGFEVGADEYLTKPPIKGEILAAVERVLNKANHLQGLSVLVVDDSAVVRKLLARVLSQEGMQVAEAENGEQALQILRDKPHNSSFDLILTDFVMPVMDGAELCRKIRRELGLMELPVIFLTSASDKNSLIDIFQAGATDYLVKPLVSEELFARLNVHLRENQLKKELYQKVQALNEANKLKDEFLSIASHDLRSPLNGVLGFVQLLEMEEGLTPEQQEYVGYIRKSGEYLLNLINDLLDLGRLQAEKDDLKLEPTDLFAVADSSIKTLVHMATPKSIHLILENHLGVNGLIQSSTNALTQVINNLLSNAIKFTPNNGEVRVILEPGAGGRVRLLVRDTGIGIAKESIPNLFDKFTTVSKAGTAGEKSTGLGMSITKTLVERMEGEIQVDSAIGQGTTFTITFQSAAAR